MFLFVSRGPAALRPEYFRQGLTVPNSNTNDKPLSSFIYLFFKWQRDFTTDSIIVEWLANTDYSLLRCLALVTHSKMLMSFIVQKTQVLSQGDGSVGKRLLYQPENLSLTL